MNSRWLAAKTIIQVIQNGQSLTTALENSLKGAASAQDKAFIQAICYGVCRFYQRLDFILNRLLDKPLKSIEVKALLLIGLYQLIYMRVKPHAAVSETVHAAKHVTWAKALINAVLRNYLRQKDPLELQADSIRAAETSHPEWLIQQLEQDWPVHANAILKANNEQPPMAIRVNVAKISRDHYLKLLIDRDIFSTLAQFSAAGIILDKPVSIEELPGFTEGWVSVQDSAAQLAAELLGVEANHRVLDVCAAPGGKTAHILEQYPEIKELVALDIDAARMQRVEDNLNRLNLQATLLVSDAKKTADWWDENLFDRILLDAPCTATGVIRRHPDIKLLRKPEDVLATALQQKQLLEAIWPLLAPGGMLLYATCSVLKQENELQIEQFLTTHEDAKELPITTDTWGIQSLYGRQIVTGQDSMDGFYYARIVKL